MKLETFTEGRYYHVYNRGNNGINIFNEKDNYIYFLNLYAKYIDPIAETYAWCLMPNHFHLLVYLYNKDEIHVKNLSYSTVEKPKIINASRQFSHFFNAYTSAFNRKYKRTGSLFEKPFERKVITSQKYFNELIFYIHNNPVHHGFEESLKNYSWSSYGTLISNKPTRLQRKKVIDLFDSIENFKAFHNIEHTIPLNLVID